MNILIVDDELPNLKLLRDLLKSFGHCDMAYNGREAVDLFDEGLTDGNPYDLILLDIMMPEMDGQMALIEIRHLERESGMPSAKKVVVIMMTALNTPKDIFEAYYQGKCNGYIVKPVTKDVLLKTLEDNKLI